MNKISLDAKGISDVTVIPNTFIDQFMPSANGAYVKVYLYLLRCFSAKSTEVTISSIADNMDNTEKDIIRALHYWEKLNLLSLTHNMQKEITSIHLMDISIVHNKSNDLRDFNENVRNITIDNVKDNNDTESAVTINSEPDKINVNIQNTNRPAQKQCYSEEKITQLTSNDEIKWIMHIVEIYLDRPLKPMDIQLIIYLYEELHFSPELIMYLFEYCVSKGKKKTSYIEAVALSWAEEGIDTEEKAKAAAAANNDHVNAVNKAFGLNRSPGQIERQYIKKWVEIFGFTDEIITEACNRAILRTQKPDFKYTDKILETWYKKGAKDKAGIKRLDEEFSKGSHVYSANRVAPIAKPSSNKFNQFPQRAYTSKDYANIERKLLNKGL
jgi:DnaD/phage-associated family protein